ncbi:MAG: 50S ribosomal protein L6 [Candidatus Babeliales bacterium]
MSKIGRKPILIGNTRVEIKGQEIHIKGKSGELVHVLPQGLSAELINEGTHIKIMCTDASGDLNAAWGLHRALIANEIIGMDKGFEQDLIITGLGFKGVLSGTKIVFSLGYSHKIDFDLPKGVSVDIDKTGQLLKVKGADKEQVGLVCSQIKKLRPTEPYKGTGIKLAQEVIFRKAGKTKSA